MIVWTLLIPPVVVGAIPLLRLALQMRVARHRRLRGMNRVEDTAFWPIGGITQAVQLRGEDAGNPLLLYIHGGPGMPAMPFGHAFQTKWEKHFTVVHWDQRDAGRTLAVNGVETGLSLDTFAEDGLGLVRLLRQRLPGRPIALVGHSWGTAIAVRMLQAAPDLFAAYLAIGQISNFLAAERYGYETVLAEARRRNATALTKSLERFPDYPLANSLTHASLGTVRGAEMKLGFGHHRDPRIVLKLLGLAFCSPDYGWRDLLTLANRKAQAAALDIALAELPRFIDRTAGATLRCPVLMVGGAFDLFTPSPAARAFFDMLRAPSKEFIEAEGLAHFGPLEDSALFDRIVIDRLLPLVARDAGRPTAIAG